jgi:hypothetical protein
MHNQNNPESIPLVDGYDDCDCCLNTVSATRPPVHNADNYSSAEQANRRGRQENTHHGVSTAYEHDREMPLFHVAPLNYTVGHVPPSNDSTNLNDFVGQEGIEQHAPALTFTSFDGQGQTQQPAVLNNHFLPLNPTTTDNEKYARRSYFFHSKLPYTMQHYLNTPDQPYATTFHTEEEPPAECYYTLPAGFLDQGMVFGNDSMVVAAQSSRQSKLSQRSSGEHSSAERCWQMFQNMDGTLHSGAWMDQDGDVFENGHGACLHMSGSSDYDNYQ